MSTVAEIVADVRARGDAALAEWAVELDGVAPARAEAEEGLPEDAVLLIDQNESDLARVKKTVTALRKQLAQ